MSWVGKGFKANYLKRKLNSFRICLLEMEWNKGVKAERKGKNLRYKGKSSSSSRYISVWFHIRSREIHCIRSQ